MISRVSTFVFVAAIFAALGSVSYGYELSSGFRVDIPFAFTAGGKTLPAGLYTVRPANLNRNALTVSSRDGRHSVIFLVNATASSMARKRSSLVLNRYGDRYFLSEVWRLGESTGRQLIPSSQERELSMAKKDTQRESIAIAAVQ